jgi:molybdopterin/thiamine biosynthesis adenylyltransferase
MSEEISARNIGIFTGKEQARISDCRVALLGLGAGSVVASLLVRTGVRNMLIIDGDEVSNSNLNRQLYKTHDVGRKKARCTEEVLMSINPELNLTVRDEYLSGADVEILKGYDVIIDTIDLSSVEVILKVHRFAKLNNIPVIFPINLGWRSLVTVFDDQSDTLEDMLGDSSGVSAQDFSFWAEFLGEFVPDYGKERYEEFLRKASKMADWCPAPQIGATVYATASLITTVLYKVVNKHPYIRARSFEYLDLYRPETL